jgi:leucyl aminopeptidase
LLLPASQPAQMRRGTLSARAVERLDALVLVSTAEAQSLPAGLPYPAAWQRLRERLAKQDGGTASMSLPNATQTLAVMGHGKSGADAFERLSLAGRLVREIAARKPERVGVLIDASLQNAAPWYEALMAALLAQSFALPDYRSKRTDKWQLRSLQLLNAPELALARIDATANAGNLVRWLTAMPPNELDARRYRALLVQLARRHGLKFRWYSEGVLRRLGAGAFLAVTRANAARDAGIAHLSWHGNRGNRRVSGAARPDVALVGKGILFDTGGINIKPHRYMLDMHIDMAGSAVALATLLALAELRAPLHAEAWLAITENNIGPTAYRPQEVIKALNGTTIQVIHSDAEGRMVLADTLALAARARPRLTLDFATLTGSCIQALTERYSGVFSNRPELAAQLVAAGAASGERLWNFPFDADFDSDLESSVADIAQCAVEGKGDHILAARFLQRFMPNDLAWAHVDLSAATRRGGLAHVDTEITGFGPRFALELLLGASMTTLRAEQRA